MSVRRIVTYPDPALRTPCSEIDAFDDDLRLLATDLLDTMHAAPGVGITGPHIGILKRITVIRLSKDEPVRVYVNPVIVEASTTMQRHAEGSVSMPGISEEIERPDHVRIRYRTLDGSEMTGEASGFLATCLQHEIDQLDGVFWLQRLSRLKRERAIRRWEKLRRA